MLILTRKVGETIYIGENVAITLVRVGAGSVRIGVSAPKELNIVRKELKDRDEEELKGKHGSID